MLTYDFYRGWYLPSNGTISTVLFDLDLNFHGQTVEVAIWTSKCSKMLTLLLTSDRKSDICHRMTPLRMLSVITLTYIFNVTNFEMWVSQKCWELPKNTKVQFYIQVDICHEWNHWECCSPWPWPWPHSEHSGSSRPTHQKEGTYNASATEKLHWLLFHLNYI